MSARFLLPVLLAGLCLPAWSATPISESRPLDARGSVEIENLKGRIEVRTWDRPEVRIGGSLGDGVERLDIQGDGKRLSVKVEYPRDNRRTEPTVLILDVPTLADLKIESVAADVNVKGVAGRSLEIESVSGRIEAVGAPARAGIETVSGDQVLTLNSRSVEVESVSGRIQLAGRIGSDIHAETVSGDIAIDSRGERLRRMESASVSGDTRIRTALADSGKLDAESVSGDIRITLPKDLSARVSGESFSGSLRAPGARINKARFGPGSDFQHRYGQGSGEVRLETFSGDAELVLE